MKKINNNPHWHAIPTDLPLDIVSWLCYEHSMTKKINQLQPRHFSFSLQNQIITLPTVFEQEYLPGNTVIQRNIVMTQNDERCLFGRTIADTALFDADAVFSTLNERPIGERLFSSPHITRIDLRCAQLTIEHELYHAATVDIDAPPSTLWSRCIRYRAWEYPLLIYEVFFPILFTWNVTNAI